MCRVKGWFQRIVFISAYHSSSNQPVKNYTDDGEQPILFATRFLESMDVKLTASPKPGLRNSDTAPKLYSFVHNRSAKNHPEFRRQITHKLGQNCEAS